MYPTRRMVILALLGVPLSLIAALVAPALWQFSLGWMLLCVFLFAADAALLAIPSGLELALHVPGAVGVARPQAADIAVRFKRMAPAKVEIAVDTSSRLQATPERQSCDIENRAVRAGFSLLPVRRGEGLIEAIWARWKGPLGLCWKQRQETLDRKLAILPDIALVKEQAMRLFQQDAGYSGLRTRLRPGEGTEFNSLREFQPGLDRRSIDWKQSARHAKLLSREFKAEENLHIVFALDTGRLMCEPLAGQPRIDRAIHSMLLISYVALKLGDRVGMFAFDERPILSSGTTAGPNAFPVLERLASRIDYSTAETNFTLGLTQLASELDHRSIVIVFTDFADATNAELMIENVRRLIDRHNVLFVAFRDEELESLRLAEPKTASDVSRAVLADTMLREREAVISRLKHLGVNVVDAPIERLGLKLLDAYLALKQRGG